MLGLLLLPVAAAWQYLRLAWCQARGGCVPEAGQEGGVVWFCRRCGLLRRAVRVRG